MDLIFRLDHSEWDDLEIITTNKSAKFVFKDFATNPARSLSKLFFANPDNRAMWHVRMDA